MPLLATFAACDAPGNARGIYRSEGRAVLHGEPAGAVLAWGPEGTTTYPAGGPVLGPAGPLWRVDREVPPVDRAPPVTAALVERAGFRMREVLGTHVNGTTDPARSAGAWVRSVVKVRRHLAPPVYVVSATRDDAGVGTQRGVSEVRAGTACEAAVAVVDARAAGVLSSVRLEHAERTCAVPVVLAPVDLEGDGGTDVLVHGQEGHAGFRDWFSLDEAGALLPGPSDVWTEVP